MITPVRIHKAGVLNPKLAVSAVTTVPNFGFERRLEDCDSSVDLVQKFSSRSRGKSEENF
jgi:hypothetical protein